ncbi:hypothetical protein U0070_017364 [Myodes glareolus]|uniref:Uncharacterized protein n=1 Tax=Myodes glareolus TaxID=447135 RepID=A0AAW0K3X7_MYOGA
MHVLKKRHFKLKQDRWKKYSWCTFKRRVTRQLFWRFLKVTHDKPKHCTIGKSHGI